MLTEDGRCTCEIKSRIAAAKAAFNKKKNLFTSKFYLNLRKRLVRHLRHLLEITKLDKEKNQCIRQKTRAQYIVKEIKQ